MRVRDARAERVRDAERDGRALPVRDRLRVTVAVRDAVLVPEALAEELADALNETDDDALADALPEIDGVAEALGARVRLAVRDSERLLVEVRVCVGGPVDVPVDERVVDEESERDDDAGNEIDGESDTERVLVAVDVRDVV